MGSTVPNKKTKRKKRSEEQRSSEDSEETSCSAWACSISGTGGSGAMLGFFREGLPVLGGGGGAEVGAGAGAGGSGAGGSSAMTRGAIETAGSAGCADWTGDGSDTFGEVVGASATLGGSGAASETFCSLSASALGSTFSALAGMAGKALGAGSWGACLAAGSCFGGAGAFGSCLGGGGAAVDGNGVGGKGFRLSVAARAKVPFAGGADPLKTC